MDAVKTVPCKLCQRPIVWGVSPDGKTRIPLDPKPPCYTVSEQEGRVVAERNMGAMVSHFATCPKVGDQKRRKEGKPA